MYGLRLVGVFQGVTDVESAYPHARILVGESVEGVSKGYTYSVDCDPSLFDGVAVGSEVEVAVRADARTFDRGGVRRAFVTLRARSVTVMA